jgi:hypothetical protein
MERATASRVLTFVLLILSCASLVRAQGNCESAASGSSTLTVYILQPNQIKEQVMEVSEFVDFMRRSGRTEASRRHPPAFMASAFVKRLAIEPGHVEIGAFQFCPAPRRVDITFGYSERTMILVREAAADRCIAAALRQHETEHAEADDEFIKSFLAAVERVLPELLGRMKRDAEPAQNAKAAEAQFERFASLLVDETAEELLTRRDQVHRQIDSEKDLEELSEACDGRLGELWRRIARALEQR